MKIKVFIIRSEGWDRQPLLLRLNERKKVLKDGVLRLMLRLQKHKTKHKIHS